MKPLPLLMIITAVLAGVFYIFPELDRWAIAPFFEQGSGFMYSTHPIVVFIYYAVPWLVGIFTIGVAAIYAAGKLTRKDMAFLLLVMAMGPGLMVNLVLKDHWGRARPYHVEHAQTKQFSPPWVMASQCEGNCSFPSGHASVGFALLSIGLIARRYAALWMGGGVMLGSLIGISRMAQGSHYMSDVLFAGLVVSIVALVLHALLYTNGWRQGGLIARLIATSLPFRGRLRARA